MIDEIALSVLAFITFMMYGGQLNEQRQEQLIQVIFEEPVIDYGEQNQTKGES